MGRRSQKKETPAAHTRDSFPPLAKALVLIAAILVAYVPAMTGEFVWDDGALVTSNPLVRSEPGKIWTSLFEIWAGTKSIDYFPLTSTLHWLEFRFFGDHATGYHIVNILLHVANSLLLWRLLEKLRILGAWLAALIFGLHPVNAASVAWISEGKNTFSTLFCLLALLAYLRFEERISRRYFISALVCFAAALLAKTHAAVLPPLLLLMAWWRDGWPHLKTNLVETPPEIRMLRFVNALLAVVAVIAGVAATLYLSSLVQQFRADPENNLIRRLNMFHHGRLDREYFALVAICFTSGVLGILAAALASSLNRNLIRLAPFFQIAALLGAVTVWFQHSAMGEAIEMGDLPRRVANAGLAFWWYLGKAMAPIRLAAVYPNWRFDAPSATDFFPVALLLLLGGVLWLLCKGRLRPVWFGLLSFIVALAPVLGFVTLSYARSGTLVADHFFYLPGIVFAALVGAGVATAYNRNRLRPIVLTVMALLFIMMGSYTWARAAVYRDEETLWRDTLNKNPNTWQGHNRLGQLSFARGDYAAAAVHYERAATLKPEIPLNHSNLGLAYARLNKFDAAVAQYRKALAQGTRDKSLGYSATITTRINLANALGAQANQLAMTAAAPAPPPTRAQELFEEAAAEYRTALTLDPQNAAAHRNLGLVLMQLGENEEALQQLERTLQLVPHDPIAHEALAELRAQDSSTPP